MYFRLTMKPQIHQKDILTTSDYLIAALPFMISAIFYILCLFDSSDYDKIVYYCTARGGTGPMMSLPLWIVQAISSTATFVIYSTMLIIARLKLRKVHALVKESGIAMKIAIPGFSSCPSRASSVEAMTLQTTRKLSKILGTCVSH